MSGSPDAEDIAGAVRPGEELDTAAVHAWLAPRVDGLRGTAARHAVSGGASNWTYRLEYDSHDLILRGLPQAEGEVGPRHGP